ncbi:hypothetical protein BDV95DRAFT_589237 [Massariosphaeria phaeospora]|uniref:Uncharacterized protein n=1 Tax=Massariosphaeria phaeospora TaxID=100035 RepID=A0A7C8MH04_9PLEO|nr:hypothetical protein BDV95DRAFT_589237 [Massariosphaeria phaeospora]
MPSPISHLFVRVRQSSSAVLDRVATSMASGFALFNGDSVQPWVLVCGLILVGTTVWFFKFSQSVKRTKQIGQLSAIPLNPKLQPQRRQDHPPKAKVQPQPKANTTTKTKQHISQDWTGVPTPRTPQPHSSVPTTTATTTTAASAFAKDGNRTGRVSTPDYQTPYAGTATSGYLDDYSQLKLKAPLSFETLQKSGMLNADGTPTKKMMESRNKRISTAASGLSSYESPIASPLAQGGGQDVQMEDDKNDIEHVQDAEAAGEDGLEAAMNRYEEDEGDVGVENFYTRRSARDHYVVSTNGSEILEREMPETSPLKPRRR